MKVNSIGKVLKWNNTPNKGDNEETVKIKLIAYKRWSHMLTRVQSELYQQKMPTYKLCSVSEDWLDYDKFYIDFINTPFHWRKDYHFDKDILVKGNKIYEFGKCAMIPPKLNSLIYRPKAHNRDLPHGVTRCPYNSEIFIATICRHGKNYTVCRSRDLLEVFNAYKLAKEDYIKEVTKQHEGLVCDRVYNSLMNWVVEFDD